MIKTEVHQIRRTHKLYRFLDNLSFNSKNIFNMANYIVRQEFFRTTKLKEEGELTNAKWIRWTQLDKILRKEFPECYQLLPSKSAQLILKSLDESWSSFFGSIVAWKADKSKFKRKPNLPRYKDKEKGRNVVILSNQQFKIKDGIVSFIPTLTKEIEQLHVTNK